MYIDDQLLYMQVDHYTDMEKTKMTANPTQLPLSLLTPIMTKDRYSTYTGLRPGQIRGQIDLKHVPTIKIGRLNMVNIAVLVEGNYWVLPSPVMTAEKFADLSGLEIGQVKTQLEKKNLPRHNHGRLILVDVFELYKMCVREKDRELSESLGLEEK